MPNWKRHWISGRGACIGQLGPETGNTICPERADDAFFIREARRRVLEETATEEDLKRLIYLMLIEVQIEAAKNKKQLGGKLDHETKTSVPGSGNRQAC